VNSAEKPTIEERLIRLEEGQTRLAQRIEDMNNSLNKRIDDVNKRIDDVNGRIDDINTRFAELRQDMNQRFEDMNQRIDDLYLLSQIAVGVLAVVLAGLIAHIIWIWKRLTEIETKVKDHLSEAEKDRLIASYREEIEKLKSKNK